MSDDHKARYRVSAKQTAKNYWQLDATVEYDQEIITKVNNPDDLADVTKMCLGKQLLTLIKQTEDQFRADGRTIVGDPE